MRLIDADALKVYHGVNVGAGHGGLRAVVYKKDIDAAPTIDPVKCGEWKEVWNGSRFVYECTICGQPRIGVSEWNYCPSCGAKMYGGKDE